MTMNKQLVVCIITASLLALGCQATPLSHFTNNMYEGEQQMKAGQYSTALASFLKANTYHPSSGAYAFAAMAAYKMNDISLADSYLVQAQGLTPNQVVTCIIYGYRSLVRFSQGNVPAGRDELTNYIAAYRNVVPNSPTLREVEFMAMAPQVDTFALQKLIDQQIQQLPIDYDRM